MGKKRIQIIGTEKEDQSKKKKESKKDLFKEKKAIKAGKGQGRLADIGQEALREAKAIEEKEKKLEKEIAQKAKKEVKKETKPKKKRGAKYLKAKEKINREKFYPLSEAIKLLNEVSISKFKGTIEVHLSVKEVGLKGEIKFPYPTGKKQIIRIADEKILQELEKGKINFTLLITDAKMMPKLVKFASLLGPKGLMPNPKSGTLTDKPQELAEKLGKKVNFRTESKTPLIHFTIGKIGEDEKKIADNFIALIKAVGKKNIKKAVLTPTMGPGLKIDLTKI